MPINLELRENNHVMYSAFVHPYTLADAAAAQKKDLQLRDGVEGTVHAILDLSKAGKPPSGLMRLAKDSPSLKHPRHGQLVVFGANLFSTTLVQLASKLANKRFEFIRFVRNEEEAWIYLRTLIAQEENREGTPSAAASK